MRLLSRLENISLEGGKLTELNLQRICNEINDIVDVVNLMLKGKVDINFEYNNFTKIYTLTEAISAVDAIRRSPGQKIRFKSSADKYSEYSYKGTDLSDTQWLNENNWEISLDLVDGGIF